jgi:hypothetical protein
MGPIGPMRTDDGPACRVCGCTQNNACVTDHRPQFMIDITGPVCCAWAETSGNDNPRWLCTACAGTEADMVDAIKRGVAELKKHTKLSIDVAVAIGTAAVIRRDKRANTLGN